jgi:hypothetical protein
MKKIWIGVAAGLVAGGLAFFAMSEPSMADRKDALRCVGVWLVKDSVFWEKGDKETANQYNDRARRLHEKYLLDDHFAVEEYGATIEDVKALWFGDRTAFVELENRCERQF